MKTGESGSKATEIKLLSVTEVLHKRSTEWMTNSFPDDWDNWPHSDFGSANSTLNLRRGQNRWHTLPDRSAAHRVNDGDDCDLARMVSTWKKTETIPLPKHHFPLTATKKDCSVLFCWVFFPLIISHFIWRFRKHARVSNGLGWTDNKQMSNQKQVKPLQIKLETFLIKIILIGFNSVELCPQL